MNCTIMKCLLRVKRLWFIRYLSLTDPKEKCSVDTNKNSFVSMVNRSIS